jgi:hypothetical protein
VTIHPQAPEIRASTPMAGDMAGARHRYRSVTIPLGRARLTLL